MQFGHRTQSSPRDKAFHHRTLPLAAVGGDGNDQATAPVSASWQAAEAAFAAPDVRPPPPQQALITVRRTRAAVFAAPPAAPFGAPSASEVDGKGPRVFRVESAQPPVQPGHPASLRPAPGPADPVVRRSRQAAADKAPGPVLHLVHARPVQREAEAPVLRLARLTAKLAAVGPVLDAIQRAQSFCFIDERSARAWQRLAQEADAIGQEIQARLR